MKEYLKKLNGLRHIDVTDITIDIDKHKLINMSGVKKEDMFYTGKFRGPIREYLKACDYVDKALAKGYGVFCDDTVYYSQTLSTGDFNVCIENLKKEISNTIKLRNAKQHGFKQYLINQRDYPLIENYIRMYQLKMINKEWIKEKLVDKVTDVERVLKLHFSA